MNRFQPSAIGHDYGLYGACGSEPRGVGGNLALAMLQRGAGWRDGQEWNTNVTAISQLARTEDGNSPEW
jgi:hypothetical protein